MRHYFRAFVLACALVAYNGTARAGDPPFPAALEAEIKAAKISMMTEPTETLERVARIEAVARGLADQRQRALALATARWLGAEANLRSNAPEKAAPLLVDGLKLISSIQEPLKLRGDLLMSQGYYFRKQEKAGEALAKFAEAHRIFVQVKEPRSQAIALQNIALLYYDANDNVRAERYFQQASEAYSADAALSLSLHNNRGNVLLTLERYADAEAEYRKGIQVAQAEKDPLLEARVLVNLARSEIDLKRFDAAGQTLRRGFTLIQNEDAPILRRHLLATAARLAADRGDYARASQLIRECFAGVDLSDTTAEYRNAHLYAHQIFSRIGEPKLALAHLEALKRLNDEATKVAITTSAALLAAQFDYANQQTSIERLKTQDAERRSQILVATVGATLIVIVALAWGLITIRRSRNKVAAANIVLGETNVALEKALKAKTEFLATTSHEIRTPLNGILGMTQVMLSDPKLEAQTRDRLGIVHGAGVTMRALVDDILDVAKIETGNLTVEPAPMDMCVMLRDVTRMWKEQAVAKGLTFSLELSDAPPCWIVSDAGRLRQIVFNLLSNAIKFTEKGGVTVRALDEGEGDSRRLKLVIADTGIGIPADKFEEIFESFRQVDTSTTRKFGGTGLGLTICRNLAEALGGEIRVESEEGQGSRFILDLPLVPAETPQAQEGAGANTGLAMLILDRNPIARSMLKTLFEPRVATLRFAASAEEARIMLGDAGVTHLLIDEGTAKAGEGEVLQTIQMLVSAAAGAASTILWVKPDAAITSQLLAAGVGQVIEKPVSGTALIDAVIPQAEENYGSSNTDRLATRAA